MSISFLVCALAVGLAIQGKPDPNVLANPHFGDGIAKWSAEGELLVDSATHSVDLLTAGSAIRQRYAVGGLRILSVGATLATSQKGYPADLRLQCFDSHERLLLNLNQPFGTKNETGIYLKTHAFTTYVIVSVERHNLSTDPVRVTGVTLSDDDKDKVAHAPEVDLDEYMRPIWRGDTVTDETALLFSKGGTLPSGKLLYKPTQILSVTDSTRQIHYTADKDYSVQGNVITRLPGSQMPMVSDTEIPKGNFPWLNLAGHHVLVSYKHADRWTGPLASYAGKMLPGTVAKVKTRSPLTVVAFGDSITLGINVSGFRGDRPYMPTWAELFVRQLGKHFDDPAITLYNTSLGGMTAEWAKENAKSVVASLNPDLVLIAFGMNDFWSFSPEQFRDNIQAAVDEIRAKRPTCEFVLVASMKFDPAYTADPMYVSKLPDYEAELKSLVGPGVALLDMTEMTQALYEAKSSKDLGTDPMHPDDFLARWYAQSLFAMFDSAEQNAPATLPDGPPQTFYIDPSGDDFAPGTSTAHPWKTLARLETEHLVPGSRVVLASGARFGGNLVVNGRGTPSKPIVIESVGKPATILSKDHPGIKAFQGGLVIRNLTLQGGASAKKDGHEGILLDARGTSKQSFVRIENVTVSGFGGDGISIKAQKGSQVGFDDLAISHVKATGNFGTGIISEDGIAFENKGYAHTNFTITDCDVSGNHSGSGLVLSGVNHALVEYCKSIGNLGAGGGVAMWAWSAKDVTFRYCIASGTRVNNGGDGGGFDLDGGCTHCVVERCLSYENDGPGYMHCDYPGAPKTIYNAIRDSVSIDDGRKPKGDSLGFGFVTWGSGLDYCSVDRDLAIVTAADRKQRKDGVFFISFIIGSKATQDVLHVRNCFVRDCVADVSGSGFSFVRSDLPMTTPSDVLFANNAFLAQVATPFVQAGKTVQVFPNLGSWRSATGQETSNQAPLTAAQAKLRREYLLRVYRKLNPRDLPAVFHRVQF